MSLRNMGKYLESLKFFDKAIQLDPMHSVAINNKGVSLYLMNRHKEANDCFRKAFEINLEFGIS